MVFFYLTTKKDCDNSFLGILEPESRMWRIQRMPTKKVTNLFKEPLFYLFLLGAIVFGILHGLLLNTYRSCQYKGEEHAYDQLARSVTGDLLTSIYLENRDMLNVGDTEGAKSMIERVDVRTVEPIKGLEDGAFSVSANWDVYGSVSHWEHTHYRCNSYKAILTVIPSEDYWKIASIEITDEERVL
jgi:hypothetical protein